MKNFLFVISLTLILCSCAKDDTVIIENTASNEEVGNRSMTCMEGTIHYSEIRHQYLNGISNCQLPTNDDCQTICEVDFTTCFTLYSENYCIKEEYLEDWVDSFYDQAFLGSNKSCFLSATGICAKVLDVELDLENWQICAAVTVKACSYRDFDIGGE